MNHSKTNFSDEQREELLSTLKVRFERHMNRHVDISWNRVKEAGIKERTQTKR